MDVVMFGVMFGVGFAPMATTANTEAIDDVKSGVTQSQQVCEFHGRERLISLVRLNAERAIPCEVREQRTNLVKTLWRAENDAEYCSQAYEDYLGRLVSLGFDCGATGSASINRATAGFD